MTKQELREVIRLDAQVVEELTVGEDSIDDDHLAELEQRAESLLKSVQLYRGDPVRRDSLWHCPACGGNDREHGQAIQLGKCTWKPSVG